jgi:hypothetical protein
MIGAQYAARQQLVDIARQNAETEFRKRLSQADDDFLAKRYWSAYVGYHTAYQLSEQPPIKKRLEHIWTDHLYSNDSEKLWAKCLDFNPYNTQAQRAIAEQLNQVVKAGYCPAKLGDTDRIAFQTMDLAGLKSFLLEALARPLEAGLSRQRGWWLSLMPGSALHELLAIQNGPNETSLGTGTLAAIVKDLARYHIEDGWDLLPETVVMIRSLDFTAPPLLLEFLQSLQEHVPALCDLVQTQLPSRKVLVPPTETSSEALAGMKTLACPSVAGEWAAISLFDPVSNDFL